MEYNRYVILNLAFGQYPQGGHVGSERTSISRDGVRSEAYNLCCAALPEIAERVRKSEGPGCGMKEHLDAAVAFDSDFQTRSIFVEI